MLVEDSKNMICPVLKKEIRITDMYTIETGGSCQMDIDVFTRSCSEQEHCNNKTKKECLLQSDYQYPIRYN